MVTNSVPRPLTAQEIEQVLGSLRGLLEKAESCSMSARRESVHAWNSGEDGTYRYEPGPHVEVHIGMFIQPTTHLSVVTPEGQVNLPAKIRPEIVR